MQAVDQVTVAGWMVSQIALPLAISFFAFQQIAHRSDAHDGAAVEPDFLDHRLFVSFPHLIAGPIIHHREMLPRFGLLMSGRGEPGQASVGATPFLVGLLRKVVIADPPVGYTHPLFELAASGQAPQPAAAWAGTLSHALQGCFDVPGCIDMAIGLRLLFGISLPPNFNSPFDLTSQGWAAGCVWRWANGGVGWRASIARRRRLSASCGRSRSWSAKTVAEAVRAIGVTEPTCHRWRAEYGGLQLDQVRRLKLLERENGRLRRAVSDLDAGGADPEGSSRTVAEGRASRPEASGNWQACVVGLPWATSRRRCASRSAVPAGCWTSTAPRGARHAGRLATKRR